MTTETTDTRCGFVAIIGATNAGKSTLVNALVGAKVSIVTHKVQTTRSRVRGIGLRGSSQIIFVDTPGIFAPRRRLDKAMVSAAWEGAGDADLTCLVVDAEAYLNREESGANARAAEDADKIISKLIESAKRPVLVLNKIDKVQRSQLLELSAKLNAQGHFAETFMISAHKGDGVEDLAQYCAYHVPKGPWLYPEEQAADMPLRLLAAEIVREKLTVRLHEELPYATMVETESWEEKADGSARIECTVFVERDGQKAIVLGKGGRTIKEIGQNARTELTEMLERPVHLFLFVKVREKWGDDPERYRFLGLELPKE